ncbi:MAG: hypothetical protein AMXMBFR7_18660 [Planctomycetota bacterium]
MQPFLTLGLLFAWALAGTAAAADPAVERFARFRDGTILRVELDDAPLNLRVVTASGTAEARTVRASELERFLLARQPRLDELLKLGALITKLADDEYGVRELASEEIRKLGAPIRQDVLRLMAEHADPEIRARLGQIMERLPADAAGPGGALCDEVVLGGTLLRADLGALTLKVRIQGQELALEREILLGLSASAPEAAAARPAAGAAKARRIDADDDAAFGAQPTRIDFERAPSGEALRAGQDIREAFVARGFRLSTSIENAIVSVNDYNVQGRSQGLSCATHQPLWQGQITIRFCVPGQPSAPACVSAFGLWIAAVSPNSTSIEAYDAFGKPILTVATTRGPNQFLGLHSRVPIASIKVVPNLAVDPDYTIDDLVFDAPRPVQELAHPKLCAARFASGERVFAERLTVSEGACRMENLSVGPAKLERPAADLRELATPYESWTPPERTPGCWLMLLDGSVLRGTAEDGLRAARLPALALDAGSLAALWGDRSPYLVPPEGEAWTPGCARILPSEPARLHPAWKLTPQGLEGTAGPGVETTVYAYPELPMVWVATPPKLDEKAGLARLNSAELLVLTAGGERGFSFVSWSADEVRFRHDSREIRVPLREVSTIDLPAP